MVDGAIIGIIGAVIGTACVIGVAMSGVWFGTKNMEPKQRKKIIIVYALASIGCVLDSLLLCVFFLAMPRSYMPLVFIAHGLLLALIAILPIYYYRKKVHLPS